MFYRVSICKIFNKREKKENAYEIYLHISIIKNKTEPEWRLSSFTRMSTEFTA